MRSLRTSPTTHKRNALSANMKAGATALRGWKSGRHRCRRARADQAPERLGYVLALQLGVLLTRHDDALPVRTSTGISTDRVLLPPITLR